MGIGNDFLNNLQDIKVEQSSQTQKLKELIEDFQNEKLIIPKYQRTFVWDYSKQSRFIESLFMNIPIPPVFLLSKLDGATGKTTYEVIDGVQRLTTLVSFFEGSLRLKGLTSLPELNLLTYSSLPDSVKEFFLERQLHLTIIDRKTNPEIQYEVFGRLNQGSVSLNEQELRNCMYHGDFNDFLIELSNNNLYRELLSNFKKFDKVEVGKPDKNRMQDVELILRYFALLEMYGKTKDNYYPDSKSKTLNYYMRLRMNNDALDNSYKTLEELKNIFLKSLSLVKEVFNGKHFQRFIVNKTKAQFLGTNINQAVFELQMLGFIDYEEAKILKYKELIFNSFLDLSTYDRDFVDSVAVSTNSKVTQRMNIWKNQLLQILENPLSFENLLNRKKALFNIKPDCSICGHRIQILEEADMDNNSLIHRYCKFSFQSTYTKTTSKSTRFKMNQVEFEVENNSELLTMIIEIISNSINGDFDEIEKICHLNYVGTFAKISKTFTDDNSKIRKYKEMNMTDKDGNKIFFNASGDNKEVIKKIMDLCLSINATNDFEIFE